MKVLLLFTGGTISMVRDAETGALHPADMQTFKAFVPELFAGDIQVDMIPPECVFASGKGRGVYVRHEKWRNFEYDGVTRNALEKSW